MAPAVFDETDAYATASGRANGTFSGVRTFVDYGQFASHFLVRAADGLHLVAASPDRTPAQALSTISRVPARSTTAS